MKTYELSCNKVPLSISSSLYESSLHQSARYGNLHSRYTQLIVELVEALNKLYYQSAINNQHVLDFSEEMVISWLDIDMVKLSIVTSNINLFRTFGTIFQQYEPILL